MENKDKEAILKKIANNHSYDTWGEAMYDTHEHTQIEYAYEAMESYSASQNKELKKQLFEHNNTNGKLINHWKDATTQLQSTIDEKNKEIAGYQKVIGLKNDELTIHRKEIERLKGLIEDAHNSGWRRGYSLHTEIGESLQQFKTDNNL